MGERGRFTPRTAFHCMTGAAAALLVLRMCAARLIQIQGNSGLLDGRRLPTNPGGAPGQQPSSSSAITPPIIADLHRFFAFFFITRESSLAAMCPSEEEMEVAGAGPGGDGRSREGSSALLSPLPRDIKGGGSTSSGANPAYDRESPLKVGIQRSLDKLAIMLQRGRQVFSSSSPSGRSNSTMPPPQPEEDMAYWEAETAVSDLSDAFASLIPSSPGRCPTTVVVRGPADMTSELLPYAVDMVKQCHMDPTSSVDDLVDVVCVAEKRTGPGGDARGTGNSNSASSSYDRPAAELRFEVYHSRVFYLNLYTAALLQEKTNAAVDACGLNAAQLFQLPPPMEAVSTTSYCLTSPSRAAGLFSKLSMRDQPQPPQPPPPVSPLSPPSPARSLPPPLLVSPTPGGKAMFNNNNCSSSNSTLLPDKVFANLWEPEGLCDEGTGSTPTALCSLSPSALRSAASASKMTTSPHHTPHTPFFNFAQMEDDLLSMDSGMTVVSRYHFHYVSHRSREALTAADAVLARARERFDTSAKKKWQDVRSFPVTPSQQSIFLKQSMSVVSRQQLRDRVLQRISRPPYLFTAATLPIPDARIYRYVPRCVARNAAAQSRGCALHTSFVDELSQGRRLYHFAFSDAATHTQSSNRGVRALLGSIQNFMVAASTSVLHESWDSFSANSSTIPLTNTGEGGGCSLPPLLRLCTPTPTTSHSPYPPFGNQSDGSSQPLHVRVPTSDNTAKDGGVAAAAIATGNSRHTGLGSMSSSLMTYANPLCLNSPLYGMDTQSLPILTERDDSTGWPRGEELLMLRGDMWFSACQRLMRSGGVSGDFVGDGRFYTMGDASAHLFNAAFNAQEAEVEDWRLHGKGDTEDHPSSSGHSRLDLLHASDDFPQGFSSHDSVVDGRSSSFLQQDHSSSMEEVGGMLEEVGGSEWTPYSTVRCLKDRRNHLLHGVFEHIHRECFATLTERTTSDQPHHFPVSCASVSTASSSATTAVPTPSVEDNGAEGEGRSGSPSPEPMTRCFGGRSVPTSTLHRDNGHFGLSPFEVWMASRYSQHIAGEVYLMDIVAARGDTFCSTTRVVDEVVEFAVLSYHSSLSEFLQDLETHFGLKYVPHNPRVAKRCEEGDMALSMRSSRRTSSSSSSCNSYSERGQQSSMSGTAVFGSGGAGAQEVTCEAAAAQEGWETKIAEFAADRFPKVLSEDDEELMEELAHLKAFLIEKRHVLSSAMLMPTKANLLERVFGAPSTVFPFLSCQRECLSIVRTSYQRLVHHYGEPNYQNFYSFIAAVFSADRLEVVRHAPRIFRTLNRTGSITYEDMCRWLARKLSCGDLRRPDAHLLAVLMSLRLPVTLIVNECPDPSANITVKSFPEVEGHYI